MIKINKIISILVTITLIGINCISVYADPSEITSNDINLNDNTNNLEVQNILQKIQDDDNRIEIKMENINRLKEEIHNKEKQIEEQDEKINEAKQKIQIKDKLLANRMKMLQINGGTEFTNIKYIEALFSSKNLLEVIQNINIIKNICKNDKKLLKEAQEAKVNLSKVKESIENENVELKENKNKLEIEVKDIENDKAKLLEYLNEYNSLFLQNQENIIPITLPSDISESAKALIDEAQKYLGTPYKWGGTTPLGFDCSGYMQYIFACNGIALPRVSQEQQQFSKPISMYEIKPGDLVFNKSCESTHVGMYVGDDQYIHAPHTGDIVKISKLSTSNMKYAGRVLENN